MRGQSEFERFRQQVEHGRCQQQAGRETDRQRQPLARQAEHDQRGGANAEDAAEQAGEDDLDKQGKRHGFSLADRNRP